MRGEAKSLKLETPLATTIFSEGCFIEKKALNTARLHLHFYFHFYGVLYKSYLILDFNAAVG